MSSCSLNFQSCQPCLKTVGWGAVGVTCTVTTLFLASMAVLFALGGFSSGGYSLYLTIVTNPAFLPITIFTCALKILGGIGLAYLSILGAKSTGSIAASSFMHVKELISGKNDQIQD